MAMDKKKPLGRPPRIIPPIKATPERVGEAVMRAIMPPPQQKRKKS